jgi:hypothetical protein
MKINNIFRRLQCFCMILFFVILVIGVTPVYATGVTEITFGDLSAKAGDEVIVPITIENNPGIASFRFRVAYDMDALELLSVEKGFLLTSGTLASTTNKEAETMTFHWFADNNVTGDGEIVCLKFKIGQNACGDYPLKVTYLENDIVNENLIAVPFTVTEGRISTGCAVSGTVTSFGEATEAVTLRLLENGTEIDNVTSLSGTYSFSSVSPGTYTIEVSKLNHTTRTYEITVEREDITEALKIHLKGDITGDGRINVSDVGKANAHAKKSVSLEGYEFACADINNDGRINISDVGKMNAHAKKTVPLW